MVRNLVIACLCVAVVSCADHEEPADRTAAVSTTTAVAGEATAMLRMGEPHVPTRDLASVPRITAEDLKAAMDAGSVAVVDVRSDRSWALEHIPGALHIPGGTIESRAGELPRERMIVTYCT